MLLMTRGPRRPRDGIAEKFESISTSWATPRVASLPDAIATPQLASFSASTSLTPSPVIATMWPRDCSAPTIDRFWCGVTRPNTVLASTASANSSVPSVGQLRRVDVAPPSPRDRHVRRPRRR